MPEEATVENTALTSLVAHFYSFSSSNMNTGRFVPPPPLAQLYASLSPNMNTGRFVPPEGEGAPTYGGPCGYAIVLQRHKSRCCVKGPGPCVSCTVGHQLMADGVCRGGQWMCHTAIPARVPRERTVIGGEIPHLRQHIPDLPLVVVTLVTVRVPHAKDDSVVREQVGRAVVLVPRVAFH